MVAAAAEQDPLRPADDKFQVKGAMRMEFRFTISIEGHGARDVAADNALALMDAFVRSHPEVSAAIGADLEKGLLEATFCASGPSLDDAAEAASRIFVDAAVASRLEPASLVGFEVEADLADRPSAIPALRHRRGGGAWTMPKLLQTAGQRPRQLSYGNSRHVVGRRLLSAEVIYLWPMAKIEPTPPRLQPKRPSPMQAEMHGFSLGIGRALRRRFGRRKGNGDGGGKA